MLNNIISQLELIEESINWIAQTKSMAGAKGNLARKRLVENRRELKRKMNILNSNPAVAVFGESQQGKSYLVSSLLSEKGVPFHISDGHGTSHDFIAKINPRGGNVESTGVVTRFSTHFEWVDSKYPVLAKLLSISDLILVLCDSYLNDVKVNSDNIFRSEDINERINEIQRKNQGSHVNQKIITEDDIYEIKDYFKLNFSSRATGVMHSDFFDKVPEFISSVPINDFASLFSVFWNGNSDFTSLLSDLISELEKVNFTSEIYLPIEAVLRENGTVIDVSRLREIFGENGISDQGVISTTNVLIEKDHKLEIVNDFSKPFLSALASELVFKLEKGLEASKTFLKNTDILDFPGARRREEIHESEITSKRSDLLLRGKVSYLFNKYSYDEKINILMLCHADEQSGQSVIPNLINDWISKMIGNTPESRNEFLKNLPTPSFFVIGTKFNLDLKFEEGRDKNGDISGLKYRWEKRFLKVLRNEVFSCSREKNDWLENWTTSDRNFKNIYLLRDYYYSSESQSNLFKGYNTEGVEIEAVDYPNYPEFRNDLKKTFLNFEFVQKHFVSPEISWDECSTINKDGSELIIKNLSATSKNISEANNLKNLKRLNEISQEITNELLKYYHDSSSDERLKRTRQKAGVVRRKMDQAFGLDPYFFGRMIRDLSIKESEVLRLYSERIDDVDSRHGEISDPYFAHRSAGLNPNESFDYNLEKLREYYHIETLEDCRTQFENDGVDLNQLFFGNIQKIKSLSQVLAESLGEYWLKRHLMAVRPNLSRVFSDSDIEDLFEMFSLLYHKLNLTEIISTRIHKYLDNSRGMEGVYEMIANISAEILNRFVNTVGKAFVSEDALIDLRRANEENNLGLKLDHSEFRESDLSLDAVGNLITIVSNSSDILNQNPLPKEAYRLPFLRNYKEWSDLLEIGFVSINDIPNYDVQANERLKVIIDKSSQINYN